MRTKRTISFLLTSLVLIGAGCGQSASVATNGTPTEKPSTTTSESCGNPYFGFKPGLTIAYSVTPFQQTAGDSDYTTNIVGVSGNTVTARTEMAGGITSNVKVNCLDHSVISTDGQDFKMTVVSSSGTFMPSDVKAGSTWSNAQTVQLESTSDAAVAAGMGVFTITTTEQSRAVADESVTIKAGTYKAVKVEVTRTSTNEFTGSAANKTPPSPSTSVEWWVKGIGMVKSITTGEGSTSTIEAKSITGA